MKNSKRWSILVLSITLALLTAVSCATGIIDPMFHYHPPLESLEYPLDNERYQNDGIVSHFTYDAVITGTSMAQNFKASQFDELFGTHCIKVCFSGGTFTEICNNLRKALDSGNSITHVLCAIDSWFFFEHYGAMRTDAVYPTYLYDRNPFNDVQYLLNKQIFLEDTLGVLAYTWDGNTTPDFDAYSSWGTSEIGTDIALGNYTRPAPAAQQQAMTDQMRSLVQDTLSQTILDLAKSHPDVQFLCFFPPYSILFWDQLQREGELELALEAFEIVSSLLLEQENVRLFSFYENTAVTGNLDLYRDSVHYGQTVSDQILQWIHAGEYELTQASYAGYWKDLIDYYTHYDYDALFSDEQTP